MSSWRGSNSGLAVQAGDPALSAGEVPGATEITRGQLLRNPARWLVIVGAVLILAGAWLPWQTMLYPFEGMSAVVTGVSTPDAPGFQLFFFVGVLAVLALSPGVAGSDTRTVQVLPAGFGLAALFVAAEAYQGLAPNIASPGQTSRVILGAGLWMSLLGSALAALGGLGITMLAIRDSGRKYAATVSEQDATPGR